MSEKLQGKVALVTGAGKRLGRAVALRLAEEGADVAIHYRESAKDAAEVVGRIEELGQRAVALRADLGSVNEIRKLFLHVGNELGRLDLLVNSAANFLPGSVISTTEEIWDASLDTNVKAPFFLCAGGGADVAAFEGIDCKFCGYRRVVGMARVRVALGVEGGSGDVDEMSGEGAGSRCARECDCSGDNHYAR